MVYRVDPNTNQVTPYSGELDRVPCTRELEQGFFFTTEEGSARKSRPYTPYTKIAKKAMIGRLTGRSFKKKKMGTHQRSSQGSSVEAIRLDGHEAWYAEYMGTCKKFTRKGKHRGWMKRNLGQKPKYKDRSKCTTESLKSLAMMPAWH